MFEEDVALLADPDELAKAELRTAWTRWLRINRPNLPIDKHNRIFTTGCEQISSDYEKWSQTNLRDLYDFVRFQLGFN